MERTYENDPAVVRAAILVILAAGVPVRRRSLNRILGVQWYLIYEHLRALSAMRTVLRLGVRGGARWTLRAAPAYLRRRLEARPRAAGSVAARTSWWLDAGHFYEQAHARAEACGWDR